MFGKVKAHIVDYPNSCEYDRNSHVKLFYLGQTKNNYIFLEGFLPILIEKDDICCFKPQ